MNGEQISKDEKTTTKSLIRILSIIDYYHNQTIDISSTDGSGDVYRNYFSFYNIDPNKYVYIENKKRATALQNIYLNSINHCGY